MSCPDPQQEPAFDPEPWQSLGISAREGLEWWRHRVEASAAVSWRRAGVSEPLDAVRWRLAGVHPGTVREWVYGGID
ncbi:MAG TPA: hypothetical protein VHX88_05310, partial [Solirubrobacteraceae bacterium]|nr:hypothetical protein [Solirubrobacteraceae bacterium]